MNVLKVWNITFVTFVIKNLLDLYEIENMRKVLVFSDIALLTMVQINFFVEEHFTGVYVRLCYMSIDSINYHFYLVLGAIYEV